MSSRSRAPVEGAGIQGASDLDISGNLITVKLIYVGTVVAPMGPGSRYAALAVAEFAAVGDVHEFGGRVFALFDL